MSLVTSASRPNPLPESVVPPLENGDRLTREEFERRYLAMPENVRAELIEGVVFMASPVRFIDHAEQHGDLMIWAGNYKNGTPGIRLGNNATVRLDGGNEPQPDVCLLIDPFRGGTVKIGKAGYIEGAPELVAEVASSTVSLDLGRS